MAGRLGGDPAGVRINLPRVFHALSLALAGCSLPPKSSDSPPPMLVIEDVTVVDVVAGRLLPHTNVVVQGDRITEVLPYDAGNRRPAAALLIDGRDRFLIPGLWDMHVHALWAHEALTTFLPLFVSQGVTGVRDMGGTLEFLAEARDSITSGARYPALVAPGPVIDGPEPVQQEISVAVGDSVRAHQVVDSLARGGADFIKVYTLLPRAAYLGVLDAAARRNMAVDGHVPADITPEEAARLGQRSMEHLRDEIEPFCTRRMAAKCPALLAVFKRYGVWQVPTLHVLRMKSVLDDSSLAADSRMQYMVPSVRQEWLSTQAARIRRGKGYFEEKRERVLDEIWLTGTLFRDQGHMLAGTDAGVAFSYPGFSLHEELELLVQAGLTPLEALRAATIEPARFLQAEDSLGAILPGKRADLVLLREDPLTDIGATRAIDAVVLRGRLLSRTTLDSMLATVREAARE